MKQFIPYLILVMGAINLQSCRSEEDGYAKATEQSKASYGLQKNSDTLQSKPEVDPDPPVKDGQDWRQ